MATRNGARPSRWWRALAVGLAGALLAAACSSDGDHDATGTTTSSTGATGGPSTPGGPAPISASLALRLSEGHAATGSADALQVVDGTALDATAIDQVIGRLPAWTVDPAAATDFNWPTQSTPPPQAGATVAVAFPPPVGTEGPGEVTTGPLEVLRHQPEGEVAIAPFASITFNQPMVPVGTVAQVATAAVPATITPPIAGRWQWIGTRTLRFTAASDAVDRLPMATEFTVTVPAGTRSASGSQLARAVSFSFATPAVSVQSLIPTDESLPLEPVFLATFDQLVDASAVLATVVLEADGEPRALRLATEAEVAADATVARVRGTLADGRWLAFRPVDPLPTSAALTIEIGPGTPSAEGPRTTTTLARYTAHTYAPLEVVDLDCGWGTECPPGTDLLVRLNNPLDADAFDPASIRIDPPLPGAAIGVAGDVIDIRGATQPRTRYHVTVPQGTRDVFGQVLAQDATEDVTIGKAVPTLLPFNQPLVTLDPLADARTVTVGSVGHERLHVRAYAVTPADWPAYLNYVSDVMMRGDGTGQLPAWPVVLDTEVRAADPDRLGEVTVDLGGALGGRPGHVVLRVEPTEDYRPGTEDYWRNRPAMAWVQATTIGVDAASDGRRLQVWATDLTTGAPLAGVAVRATDRSAPVTTDADGLASLDLAAGPIARLEATRGDETALVTPGFYGGWEAAPRTDDARWYVVDDRQVYRPEETASFTGWVRRLTTSTDAQLQLLEPGATVGWVLRDSRGNQVADGTTPLGPLGGFAVRVPLPATANLGIATLQLTLDGVVGLPRAATVHQFQIQEFRRPEFEVTARHESPGPFVGSQPATVAVDANYYAGGPLGAAPVSWQVTTAPASYAPPGWDAFSFGEWTPWWSDDVARFPDGCCVPPEPDDVEHYDGMTDADGTHYLQIDFGGPDGARPDVPVTVTAEATVTDLNRQAWASRTSVLVHPATLYVGLRSDRTFVKAGDPLVIQAIVTDIDGAAVAGRAVHVTAARLEWVLADGRWSQRPTEPQTCDTTSAAQAVECRFATSLGGAYRVTATVVDDAGGTSRTELTRWVTGHDGRPSRGVEQQDLTIVPDRDEYAPGDTAQLLVQSPFSGTGLLTVTRNGIASNQTFAVTDGSAVVTVPLADADIPGVGIAVEVVGTTPRTADDGTPLPDAPPRPAFATGQLTLPLSTASRTLTVTATPRADSVVPGATTQVDVAVADAAGASVAGARVAVIVVDEAVLALSGYDLTDPLSVFYGQLSTYLSITYGRQSILLVDPATLANGTATGGGAAAAPTTTAAATAATTAGGAFGPTAAPAPSAVESGDANRRSAFDQTASGESGGTATAPIGERTNFDPLAVFAPDVTVGPDGRAVVDVPLPDNLTRYRVMAVAVAGADRFGSAESTITARLPLTVRPSAPRFANFGDRFDLPVLVQNQTAQPMTVDVVLQTANLTLAGPGGRRVEVPADDRVEVRFPVTTDRAGTARYRVAAVSVGGDATGGGAADATTAELPVYTPATTEAFATYGVLDDGATVQPLLAPTDVVPQFGGLEVTTSSTALQALTDAVISVTRSRWDSSDAMASRILTITALRDVLDAFAVDGAPTPAQLDATVRADIDALVAMQNDDGGFPSWARNRPSLPYQSIQVAQALVLARQAGFAVPDDTAGRALRYVADIESHIPAEWGVDLRDTTVAYALRVRMLAGDRDTGRAARLWDQRGDDLPLEALAWLWPVIDDPAADRAIGQLFDTRAVDTAGATTFTTGVVDGASVILQSQRRTDGIALGALIARRPASDLIPKVVTGLLGARTAGHWGSFQEDTAILLSLKTYFDTYEAATPDFTARVWLGSRSAGEHAFSGRTTERASIAVPTATLATIGDTDIVVAKDGTGRLYYRLGLRYAPADLHLDPLDRGFVVQRSYEAVDDPADVTRDADGTWHVRAGATVRVRLTMVAESQRNQVALVDPLPAGLEILNPALATTPELPPDPQAGDGDRRAAEEGRGLGGADVADVSYCPGWCGLTWFDHQALRDDRAEAYASQLPAGTYDYSYVARATTPGTFVTPPTRAEEIYAPETFGRAATDTVVVDG